MPRFTYNGDPGRMYGFPLNLVDLVPGESFELDAAPDFRWEPTDPEDESARLTDAESARQAAEEAERVAAEQAEELAEQSASEEHADEK
jgi:hypothetical protein